MSKNTALFLFRLTTKTIGGFKMEVRINKIIIEKGFLIKPAKILLKKNGICELWVEGKMKRLYPTIEEVFEYENFFNTDENEYKRGLI